MTKEADEILKGASDYASGEFASSNLSNEHKDMFLEARTGRRIRLTGDNAAKDYYKRAGRHFDSAEYEDSGNPIPVRIFLYSLVAFLINLVLYFPVYYLLISWGGANRHDAVYITIIINTAISTVLTGIYLEFDMKHKAFIAGMHAEARDHVVGKYHEAENKLTRHYMTKND